MLFDSREVAGFISETFEPVWESVRPAPLVTIDFGNGHVLTRTLQGNVATYVCLADGRVADVLPGIYTPRPYCQQLAKLAELANTLRPLPAAEATAKLREYHVREAEKPLPALPGQAFAVANIGGGIKGGGPPVGIRGGIAGGINGFGGGGIQGGIAGGGAGSIGGGFGGGIAGGLNGGGIEGPLQTVLLGGLPAAGVAHAGDLASHPGLAIDTQVNEALRRRQVHQRLATAGPVRPDDVKPWLYNDVLHTDLDDPLLGLGPVLNATYPFAEEDRKAAGR